MGFVETFVGDVVDIQHERGAMGKILRSAHGRVELATHEIGQIALEFGIAFGIECADSAQLHDLRFELL